MPTKGLRLVVTGGIGSGKSTVTELLRRRGFEVADADELARSTLEPGGEAFSAVARRWPAVVVDGRIDRSALADIVFSDPVELEALEELVHPLVRRRIAELDEETGVRPLAVEISVPKVLPRGWSVILVEAPEAVRIARAVERGADEDDTRRRMASQPGEHRWRSLADYVLVNDADLGTLERRLDRILEDVDGVRDC